MPGALPVVGAAVVLIGAAIVASLMPAARASRVDLYRPYAANDPQSHETTKESRWHLPQNGRCRSKREWLARSICSTSSREQPLSRSPAAVAAGLIAALCYVAVTLVFYDIFKPVDKTLSLIAALFSLLMPARRPQRF